MLRKLTAWAVIGLSALMIGGAGLWLWLEARWTPGPPESGEAAFFHRSIGLEAMPLKYAAVLQSVSGHAFSGDGSARVFADFGFLSRPETGEPRCAFNVGDWAPEGLHLSSRVPVAATPVPTDFVGLSCAACHAGRLRLADDNQTATIPGLGNQELDLIAWSEGLKSAILDPALTAGAILEAYEAQCAEAEAAAGARDGWLKRQADRIVIGAWLAKFRNTLTTDLAKYGLPVPPAEIRDPEAVPAGPGRTRPFRSVVRVALDLPGADNWALSKIPVTWGQARDRRAWSQYDGSLGSPVARSLIAAYASGASLLALGQPDVAEAVKRAAAYTETLQPSVDWSDLFFPDPDPAAVTRGRAVYMAHCNDCHGAPDGDGWSFDGATRAGRIIPIDEIGTDDQRVTFRYAWMLPDALYTTFPGWDEDLDKQKDSLAALSETAAAKGDLARSAFWLRRQAALDDASREHRTGHPLAFSRAEIRAGDEATGAVGYIANPIEGAFLRAPYLHNGSVPTMAQLINLEDRPTAFCRGRNRYDPQALGYEAPPPPCDDRVPFLFDTAARGNSNKGHDYPWPRDQAVGREGELRDLLEFLKTF